MVAPKKHRFEHGEAKPVLVCVHICVCMCARKHACVHTRVCACIHVRARVCACESVSVSMHECLCACVRSIPTIFLYCVSLSFFLGQSLSEPGAYQLHTSWPVNSRSPPPHPGIQKHTAMPSLLHGGNHAQVLS